ncbi:MAG: M23 family metallopeptidase [Acidimicrobiia bacterium]
MKTHLRLVALAIIGISVMSATLVTNPASAQAAAEPEDPSFVMTVFPIDTVAVNFWDSWGARRSGGRRHQGTDIMSPRGTPILAVSDGTVEEFGTHRLSGYFVRLDHGNGTKTTYMHLNNDLPGTDDGEGGSWTAFYPTLTEGQEVAAGQIIGYVGDSGNAEGTQPHVHFELRLDGEKTNPFPYLKDVWDREMRLTTDGVGPH